MFEMPTMLEFFEDQPRLAARYPRTDTGELGWLPAVDVRETADEVVVLMALPGVRKDDFFVEAQPQSLVVTGRRDHRSEDGWVRREMIAGPFTRSVELPAAVKAGDARLTHRDGILEVRLPKQAPAVH